MCTRLESNKKLDKLNKWNDSQNSQIISPILWVTNPFDVLSGIEGEKIDNPPDH